MREVCDDASPTLGPPILRQFASNVNMRMQNTYRTCRGVELGDGAAEPVPPPSRLVPTTITVNEPVVPKAVTLTP